jgi:hypothetical protein
VDWIASKSKLRELEKRKKKLQQEEEKLNKGRHLHKFFTLHTKELFQL